MDYSVCLLLLLSSISSVSVGAGFPTAQMWVQLQKQPVGSLKKSWIIRCVWLFFFFLPHTPKKRYSLKHWCYIQYVFLWFIFSLYCSWWNIIPGAPQRVLLSQVMMIAHYFGCSFTLWNRIFEAAFSVLLPASSRRTCVLLSQESRFQLWIWLRGFQTFPCSISQHVRLDELWSFFWWENFVDKPYLFIYLFNSKGQDSWCWVCWGAVRTGAPLARMALSKGKP